MIQTYQAPKPQYTRWHWFKFIGIRIIFPPILLWDLLKLGANKLFGGLVSHLVLSAQKRNHSMGEVTIDEAAVDAFNKKMNQQYEKHQVITYDKAQLDTLEIKYVPNNEEIATKDQMYIINLVGNGMCYEDIIDEMSEDANVLKANVVGFNFRNVKQSTGQPKSAKDLVTDGIAQVQRLLDKGVSSKNITLKGHSLGAGIASLVAQHFHQIGQPIKVFNGRSFSSITNFLVGYIRLARDQKGKVLKGHNDSMKGIILGWLAKPFIKLALALVKWEINAGSAFKSIPKEYRAYIVVRSNRERRVDRCDDGVISHYASIHKELTSERRADKAKIDAQLKKLAETETEEKESLVNNREKIKSSMKMETGHQFEGHNLYLINLRNRSGMNAATFFSDFFQRKVDASVNSGPILK